MEDLKPHDNETYCADCVWVFQDTVSRPVLTFESDTLTLGETARVATARRNGIADERILIKIIVSVSRI